MEDFDFADLSILIAEESRFMLTQLRQQLRTLGSENLYEALDGEEAFSLLCAHKPDFVFVDCDMEPVSGLSFVRQVRTSKQTPNPKIPIIVLVNNPTPTRLAAARDAGATEILTKPVSAQRLTERIQHILAHHRQFVQAENFIGPDRRRKRPEGTQKTERRQRQDASAS